MRCALLALLGLLAGSPSAQDPARGAAKAQGAAEKTVKLNSRVESEWVFDDLGGKSRNLFAEHKDQPLVLVFWSYRDPVSRFYGKRLAELAARHAGKCGFYLVDSNYDELVSAGDPLKKLREVVAAEGIAFPILLDPENKLANDLGAIANGQAFLLDGNRFLRYHGGIDDDPDGKRGEQGLELRAWLATALDEVLAGQRPKENWTRPSGRPIKRVPKAKK